MKNTMNEKKLQEVAAAVMNDVRNSGAKVDTMDEMYETACKYVQVSREQFEELCTKIKNNDFLPASNSELSDDDLDAVVGGGFFSYCIDHAAMIGIAVGTVAALTLIATGVGSGIGLGIAATTAEYIAETGAIMWGAAAADGALMGAVFAGGGGTLIAGLYGICQYKQDSQEGNC